MLLALGAALRFWNLKDTVLDGCDVFEYLKLGAQWAQGDILLAQIYAKPGFALLCSLAVKLWGAVDHAVP